MKKIENPLLEEFLFAEKNVCFLDQFVLRSKLIKKYSFAIPDEIALNKLVELSPVIEIGAGLGYWASLVNQMGGKVICYDDDSWELEKKHGRHTEILPTNKLNYDDFPVCSLFMCWPPMDEGMSEDYLNIYINHGGKRVIYVGESWGGCTANDSFFEILEKNFEETFRHDIPNWYGIHDSFYVYERKI